MMRTIQLVVVCAALLAVTAEPGQASLIVVDSINEFASNANNTWNATEVGWFYTPSFSYDLAGIATKFGTTVDSRTVTVEIYDAFPGSGGNLLRSADFTPLAIEFAGGQFAPLQLTANDTYFFGFRNVGGLSVNVTNDVGATNLPGGLRYSFSNNGSYANGPETAFTAQPIVQFQALDTAVVPEPTSLTLLGIGTLALAIGAARRRRT